MLLGGLCRYCISTASPSHALPQEWGISFEKRKPLPHYVANFSHQEKMFGRFWPRIQMLEGYPLYLPFPWVKRRYNLVVELQAQRNSVQHIHRKFKSVLSEPGIKCE